MILTRFRQSGARGGWTLVELLVVLAILSTLAALLFSAFAGAREKGRQATCASNLKQIGLAFSLYADDNAHFLPPGMIEGAQHVWQMWPQTVLPYLKTDAVFVCPTDTAHRSQPFSLNSSYGYNTDIAGNLLALIATKNRPDLIPKTDAQIARPTATIMVADSGVTPTEGLPSSQWPVLELPPSQIGDSFTHLETQPVTSMMAAPNPRHHGRANLLWADGHVSALPLDSFYNAPDHKRPQDKLTGISPCLRAEMGCD